VEIYGVYRRKIALRWDESHSSEPTFSVSSTLWIVIDDLSRHASQFYSTWWTQIMLFTLRTPNIHHYPDN
jgi:hypothetical protein